MKHTHVTYIFIAVVIVPLALHGYQLTNKRLKKFDDRKVGQLDVGINGALIHDMLWVIDTINGIQYGSKRHNKSHSQKLYRYHDDWYTLEQLVEEEKQGAEDLSDVIECIKEDFHSLVSHFMQQLIMKTVVCNAVEEWCTQSQRPDSLLKVWARTNREEFESVYRNITTAAELSLFLTDLKEFLTDVINSCPRAWYEFLEHQDQYVMQTEFSTHHAQSTQS